MYLIKSLTLILILISIGCKPLKNLSPTTYSIEPIPVNELTRLDGRYNNFQDTVFGKIEHFPLGGGVENNRTLLDRLFVNYPENGYDKWMFIEIKFTTNKNAVVYAYQNGALLFSKNIRGKLKNGYFYLRPKMFIIPFFPVFYWHNFERIRIGKTGNDIVVDHSLMSWGFALFAGGSDYGLSTSIYKGLEK